MSSLIKVENLSFGYGDKALFSGVSLDIKDNSKIVICGKNGSGKSTFLSILAGIKDCDGIVAKQNLKVSYLFQDSNDQFIAPNVLDDVAFSLLADGVSTENALSLSLDMLKSLKILHLKDKSIYSLSGGEKRIVAIAGMLVRSADIYMLDEPFNELDDEKIELVLNLLYQKSSFVIITHRNKESLNGIKRYEIGLNGLAFEDFSIF